MQKGLITSTDFRMTPISGGVSSDIWLVEDQGRKMVVKQALETLKVHDEWKADPSRNSDELRYIEFIKTFRPEAVPDILLINRKEKYFVMEYFDQSFQNWKSMLLAGHFITNHAAEIGELMADIHLHSWHNTTLAQSFNTYTNFHALRIDPYLLTTGRRNPSLYPYFKDESERLSSAKEALVHGDFSPKNILIGLNRIILLDHEVAWYGDPAFDIAFLLNHLFLKRLWRIDKDEQIINLAEIFWQHYFQKVGNSKKGELEANVVRLLLMLLLARVDGKSPVEYLTDYPKKKSLIKDFVYDHLPSGIFSFSDISTYWVDALNVLKSRLL